MAWAQAGIPGIPGTLRPLACAGLDADRCPYQEASLSSLTGPGRGRRRLVLATEAEAGNVESGLVRVRALLLAADVARIAEPVNQVPGARVGGVLHGALSKPMQRPSPLAKIFQVPSRMRCHGSLG